jgi:peptidoglycan/xylan/chitin deacetylase (PgdA/CDA1 family)
MPPMSSSLFHVLPWNGYKAALSLTFDDGDPSQLDLAIPEMEKRGLTGTFYLITGRLTRPQDWKKAANTGQEIGNHSLSHKRSKDLAPGEAKQQVAEAKKALEDLIQKPVLTFAYPFTDITPDLRKAAVSAHLLSRGGLGASYCMEAGSDPDWDYLPSLVARTLISPGVYKGWADEAIQRESWVIPQFHAFEGTALGWQPLPRKNLCEFLDFLVEVKKDLWTAPLGQVGGYWRAQKTLEESSVKQEGSKYTWAWEKSSLFPGGITLKVKINGGNIRAWQKGKKVKPLYGSVYPISFDEKELTVQTI